MSGRAQPQGQDGDPAPGFRFFIWPGTQLSLGTGTLGEATEVSHTSVGWDPDLTCSGVLVMGCFCINFALKNIALNIIYLDY